jgi:UDP-N-acetylmuramate--alanine ligase
LPIKKRAVWIGSLTRQKQTLAISGTHGKTTTTAMLGWILEKAGLDPTVFVGGSLKEWGNETRIGNGPLVLEADEFDRSFHNFKADMAAILNIEADHLDYYKKGLPEIEHSFRRFLRNLPAKKGLVVAYGKNASIRKVCRGFSYAFRFYDEAHLWPGISLKIPGTHNLLNATAAARIAHELGVSHVVIKEALASFPGVGRRFEYLGRVGEAEVYDDYAHHPTEVAATLQAARSAFPDSRLTIIFQPHQKARTLGLIKEFGRCFDANTPDELILAPIYHVAGREDGIEVSSSDIAIEIAKSLDLNVTVAGDVKELESLAKATFTSPGVVISMGAGSLRSMMETWII